MYFTQFGSNMTSHKLEVLRSLDSFEGALIKNLEPSAVQEEKFSWNIPAGRCVSRAANGKFELGVSGQKVPYFLFRSTAQPSTGAVSSKIAVQLETDITWKSDADHLVLCYCGIEGMEMATTEFDTEQTYALNEYLTAPDLTAAGGTDDDLVNTAGKLTNVSSRSGGGAVLWGADPIVGIVSENAFRAPHRVDMLVFYTLFRPAIQGVLNSVSKTVAA